MSYTTNLPVDAPFSKEQRQWISGYLSGLASVSISEISEVTAVETVAQKTLLVLFGSQSGNAESLAKGIGKKAQEFGFGAKVKELNETSLDEVKTSANILLATSTWGEGEMPDNAVDFWANLSADDAIKMDGVNYSVLALGDTNYADFCEAGKNFDTRFEALGARRVYPRVDCDVDFEEPAEEWIKGALSAMSEFAEDTSVSPSSDDLSASDESLSSNGAIKYDRKNHFPAQLLDNRELNGKGSAKDVRHIAFSLEDSGLEYEVGDALGVMPENDEGYVDLLIKKLSASGDEKVETPDGVECSLKEALLKSYDITKVSPKFLKLVAESSGSEKLASLLEKDHKKELDDYLWGRDPLDILTDFPCKLELAAFIETQKKLNVRLYSIASSPKAHPGEVHLTVGAVRWKHDGRSHGGVCSTFMADRLPLGNKTGVFVQVSHGFRLPEDMDKPVIMVGPGTGIAPFRAFLEERSATKATGKNWLFFGDQHADTDFLYREQLEEYKSSGLLNRLSVAFSRDQEKKIYVQTRMIEEADELWSWLQEGAHFYVCGDASRMAKDVDKALHQIAMEKGGMSEDDAKAYIKQLKNDKRYQRDVY
ncbi:MAG: sulfite reductase subunit alpha [Verrucomicrobiota bacterium]